MAITLTEDWVKDIKDELFDGQNSFITMSRSHDEFVKNKIVHIPQSGSLAGVTKNRSSFPATVEQRTDTDLNYTLEDYSVDPVLIEDIENMQNSYSKRDSVMFQHKNKLKEQIALNTIFDWSTDESSQLVITTGADEAAGPVGSTGLRKRLIMDDIRNASIALDNQNVPDDGRRILMLPSNMYADLFDVDALLRNDIVSGKTLPSGVQTKIMGFNIMKRGFCVNYNEAGTAKIAIGAAVSAADNSSAIAWHPDFVAKALGTVKVFTEERSPLYYGDLLSAQVLFKASRLRNSSVGIVNIIQDA